MTAYPHQGQRCTHLTEQGRELPGYVQREFEDYLKCGRLEHGFLRVRCASCHTEHLVAFSCKRRGFCPSCGARRKVFSLQTLPACDEPFDDGVGKVAGFSLHAGVAVRADERKKLERLCRYISRPAVSEKRLSLTRGGNVRYQLKTPYRDGTTHVIFEPLDFIAQLAALVPKPRVNLTRFHGVFAPNSKHRALVTPAKRGRGNKVRVADEPATPAQRRALMAWAQRLKRVFNIDIETCSACGGAMKSSPASKTLW